MKKLVNDAKAIFGAAVQAVQAPQVMAGVDADALRPAPGGRCLVAGAGKASMAMAGVLEQRLGPRLSGGRVVVPHGYPETLPPGLPAPRRVAVDVAGHPLPDEAGVQAAGRQLALAAAAGPGDLLIVLLSGGGSALLTAPAPGLSLRDLRLTAEQLLRSGADIYQINTVRKHLSRLGGGQLAAAAAPAAVRALVLSDVVGDDLSVVASGPTVPDPSTYGDALAVLTAYGLMAAVPAAVVAHLRRGGAGMLAETPKPGAPAFAHVQTTLAGSNQHALLAAQTAAQQRGYAVALRDAAVTGEAREVGRRLAEAVLAAPPQPGRCWLWGGETTVTVTGAGRGGRNQEVALAAALALEDQPRRLAFLSGGTDGIDGPTDAAGAWATPGTVAQARTYGRDAAAHLAGNDAYPFFEALGALLMTGPTHTNVMDVIVMVEG